MDDSIFDVHIAPKPQGALGRLRDLTSDFSDALDALDISQQIGEVCSSLSLSLSLFLSLSPSIYIIKCLYKCLFVLPSNRFLFLSLSLSSLSHFPLRS